MAELEKIWVSIGGRECCKQFLQAALEAERRALEGQIKLLEEDLLKERIRVAVAESIVLQSSVEESCEIVKTLMDTDSVNIYEAVAICEQISGMNGAISDINALIDFANAGNLITEIENLAKSICILKPKLECGYPEIPVRKMISLDYNPSRVKLFRRYTRER